MNNRRLPSLARLLLAPLAALLLTTPCLPCEDEPRCSREASQAALTAALETLETGRPALKRLTVEKAREWAGALTTADVDDEQARHAVGWLRAILQTEKDDWITSRLLQNLPHLSSELLNPLYRDALTHPSPNVRWRAMQWFMSQRDPEAVPLLEKLWPSESRPWVVPDLIEALAFNASEKYGNDFVALARGRNAPLALAAIRAFELLHAEARIPDLAEIAQGRNRAVSEAAVTALATFMDSLAALEAVLEATRSADREQLLSSIPLLKNFPSADAVRRLMEMARAHADPQARQVALASLASMRPDGFSDLLVGILHEPSSEALSCLQSAAIAALSDLDDPHVLPKLSGLDPSLGEKGVGELPALLESLSRDRSVSLAEFGLLRIDCAPVSSRSGDGDVSYEARVAPPENLKTIRCWEFPGVPGDPEDFTRLSGGSEVWVGEHFERGEEPWVRVSASDIEDCWVPWRALRPAADDAPKGSITLKDPFRIEIDLSFTQFEGETARRLRDAGLLARIEPGDEVVGVALALHPDEVRSLPTLLTGYRGDGSLLDDAVATLLDVLSKALPNRPELMKFFRKHPEAREALDDSDPEDPDENEILLIDP